MANSPNNSPPDSGTIEQYQKVLAANSQSQIFVLLAEALREGNQLPEALQVAQKGVLRHPKLVSGQVTLGRILFDLKKYDEAFTVLQKAATMSPENILVHQMLGEIFIQQKKTKEALKSFKKVLYLNPLSERAYKIISKLESLTADEYEDEVFQMRPLQIVKEQIQEHIREHRQQEKLKKQYAEQPSTSKDLPIKEENKSQLIGKKVQKILSLCDAYLARGNNIEAFQLIKETLTELKNTPYEKEVLLLISRKNMILKSHPDIENPRIYALKNLLSKIDSYRSSLARDT